MSERSDAVLLEKKRAKKHPSQAPVLSRRDLFAGAAAAALAIVPRSVLGGNGQTPPSDKLNIAVVGTGCQGIRHIEALLANQPDIQLAAVCDVNREGSDYYDLDAENGIAGREPARQLVDRYYAEQTRTSKYKGCASYSDFREMLEKEKSIDAVLVATPDHTHAIVAMQAIKAGKHVYCEKPLTHTIDEARKLAEAARQAKVATQMGNQFHADDNLRLQVETIRSGVIGQVREVHAWCGNARWHGPWSQVSQRRWAAIGQTWVAGPDRPQDAPQVPAGLDWDLWLGPAPYRPFHPAYVPFKWRGWWDFGSGMLGDMGCHVLDAAFWALELGHPTIVEASSTRANAETAPVAATVHYQFPARGDMPSAEVIWYDGGLKPARPSELAEDRDLPAQGLLFIGDQGKLLAGFGNAPTLLPESRMKDFKSPEKSLPRIKPQGESKLQLSAHHREWIDACQGGPSALSSFDYAGPLTEAVLLGVIAIRTDKRLHWNGQNMTITNVPAANAYVQTSYRQGWTL